MVAADGDPHRDALPDVDRLSRRGYLGVAGALGLTWMAGCGSGGGDGTESTPTPSGTGSAGSPSRLSDVLRSSPSSHIAPNDGFASVDWLDEAEPAVKKVTTLESSGAGSLRRAVSSLEARIVVFEVGGVIDLQGEHVSIDAGRVFVAGQTAPSPGITLVRGALEINAPNVVVQHLSVRPGDEVPGPTDSITNSGGRNVIVDHCSASWGTDETLSTNSGPANPNITYSNNIVSEGLSESIHPKGAHSMGSLVMNNSKRVALAGNLWAHNNGRNPRLKGGTSTVVVNNVAYNFGRGLNLGGGVSAETVSSIVGNHYRAGTATDDNQTVVGTTFTDAAGPIRAFIAFNDTEPPSMQMVTEATDMELTSTRPIWPEELQSASHDTAFETVLQGSGARPAERSAIDRRIVSDVRNFDGRIIDSQRDVGGYPEVSETAHSLLVPDDLGTWLYEHTKAVEVGG